MPWSHDQRAGGISQDAYGQKERASVQAGKYADWGRWPGCRGLTFGWCLLVSGEVQFSRSGSLIAEGRIKIPYSRGDSIGFVFHCFTCIDPR